MRYLIVVALLLTACASAESRRATLQANLDKSVGKPVEELLKKEGPPTRTEPKGPPGEFLYVYDAAGRKGGDWCTVTYVVAKGAVTSAYQTRCY